MKENKQKVQDLKTHLISTFTLSTFNIFKSKYFYLSRVGGLLLFPLVICTFTKVTSTHHFIHHCLCANTANSDEANMQEDTWVLCCVGLPSWSHRLSCCASAVCWFKETQASSHTRQQFYSRSLFPYQEMQLNLRGERGGSIQARASVAALSV